MPPTVSSNPPGNAETASIRAAKAALRERIRAARAVAEPPATVAERTARALGVCAGHPVIALYASAPGEPDTWSLIRQLDAAGHRLLLPLLGRRPDGTVRREPDWAEFAGVDRMRRGYAGILEPTGPGLGAEALARASLVWCAGLAATPSGDRLGTGGGWYDRALAFAGSGAVLAVLLRDAELLDSVPVEPFDRRIGLIVTEQRTLAVH